MHHFYAPGCALTLYKPQLADKLKTVIEQQYGPMDTWTSCCFNQTAPPEGAHLITPCATCAEQYAKQFPQCTTSFFLATLAESDDFPFPDYGGKAMSIQDTCTARSYPEYLAAVRKLLERMNIRLVEPAKTGSKAKCCGQVLYGKASIEKVENFMKTRAGEMPCEDVVVYCSSCIMSMTVGGRRPRYILDLLFGESTSLQAGITEWNQALRCYRNNEGK